MTTRLAELDIPSTVTSNGAPASDFISGYAAYDNGVLARAVFVNLNAFLTTTSTKRGSAVLNISVPEDDASNKSPASMRVRRLAIGHADDTEGLTFGGRTYETDSGRPAGMDKYEDVPCGQGVTISDTEAILVTFQY